MDNEDKYNKNIFMILTNGFNPDVRVYKEAKFLVQNGYNVTILCWDRKCKNELKIEENIDGINIKRFKIQSKPGSGMKQLIPFLKFAWQVRKYLKKQQYEYLHCHDFDGILIGLFCKNKEKKRRIFDMHEIYDNYAYAKNIFFKNIFNAILNRVDYIIYVNTIQVENIEQKQKLVYLPNYPIKELYQPINKNNYDKIRVNYIGALRDYKSLICLSKIADNNEKYKIGLYGDGVCYEQLKMELRKSNVYLSGKYNGIKDSGEIYRNTDILYCSYNPDEKNWNSSYPVKLFEAIVTNTPIIVTKNTIAGKFVKKNEIGEEIIYNDKESLLKAIEKISENYNVYVEKIKDISDNYKWEYIVENLKKIYGGKDV